MNIVVNTDRVESHGADAAFFVYKIFGVEDALITDQSSIGDFDSHVDALDYARDKIKEVFQKFEDLQFNDEDNCQGLILESFK